MSLIQQALDKAGQTPHTAAEERKIAAIPESDRGEEEQSLRALEQNIEKIEQKTRKFSRWFVMSLCLTALILGGLAIYFWMDYLNQQAVKVQAGPKPSAVLMEPRRPEKAVSSAQPVSQQPFQLSGITTSAGERYALVNNDVVTVGDMIQGTHAVVKAILSKTVVVEYQGRDVVLSLEK